MDGYTLCCSLFALCVASLCMVRRLCYCPIIHDHSHTAHVPLMSMSLTFLVHRRRTRWTSGRPGGRLILVRSLIPKLTVADPNHPRYQSLEVAPGVPQKMGACRFRVASLQSTVAQVHRTTHGTRYHGSGNTSTGLTSDGAATNISPPVVRGDL